MITPEEAIRRIEACRYTPNFQPYLYMNEALDMAVDAIKKQIPRKPVGKGCVDSAGNWHEWMDVRGLKYELCPSCKRSLSGNAHCDRCGQAIDWT